MRRPSKLPLIILALALALEPALAVQAADVDGELTAMATASPEPSLSPAAQAIAEQMGVMPLIEKLRELKLRPNQDLETEVERLKTKQALNAKVMIGTLQVRDVTARIERQISILNRMRGLLEDKRDRAIKYNSIANIFALGGVNELGQALEMPKNELAGEIIELAAGLSAVVLGGLALKQQSGGVQRVPTKPNMLAQIFGKSPDQDCTYPPLVWRYLSAIPAEGQSTRIEILMERWKKYNVISGIDTAKGKRLIETLTNTEKNSKVTIDNLNDEAEMLADVKAEVFQLDRDLLDLLLNLQGL